MNVLDAIKEVEEAEAALPLEWGGLGGVKEFLTASIDAAWADAAMAAETKGSGIFCLTMTRELKWAAMTGPVTGFGATPATALRDLAHKLRSL